MFNLQEKILLLPGILLALTVHEYCHGLAAFRLGDPTARDRGRLTLNPLAHLDPIGTILLFLFYFGWAKPVPINPYNFRGNIRQGLIWVSFAGPASNVALAFALGLVFRGLYLTGLIPPGGYLFEVLVLGIFINLMLAFFNLVPIPPLDGSKIVEGLLPVRYLAAWANFERYGFFILIGIILLGRYTGISIFGSTIIPLARLIFRLFAGLNFRI